MKLAFTTDDSTTIPTDLLVVPVFEELLDGDPDLATLARGLDLAGEQGAPGFLLRLLEEEQFKGKKGQQVLLHTHRRLAAGRLLLVGSGPRHDYAETEARHLGARAVKAGQGVSARRVTIVLPLRDGAAVEHTSQLLAEGALLGGYRFDRYLSEKRPTTVEEGSRCGGPGIEPARRPACAAAVQRGERVAAAVARARDLVNEPAGSLTPSRLAEVAAEVAGQHGLELKVLGASECAALGMGMFLAVAQGSEEPPRFIHLAHRPAGDGSPRKKVLLVGKGVTFDSGGLSLKPSASMEDMKTDMAGAATVICAIGLLAELGCPHEVHALAACTENMPSGRAYKLGDVLTSMSGKTVEINNTDAEGRLTLGDALTYGLREVKPDEAFDFATLTGACLVALGPHIAGVMGNDDGLVERWLAAARTAGEEMWRLPLAERLKDQLKSDVADLKNTGDRWGGAITAGLFLKEFVGATPWVHVDLAGPSAADKEFGYVAKGGTGFAVATLAEYLAPRR